MKLTSTQSQLGFKRNAWSPKLNTRACQLSRGSKHIKTLALQVNTVIQNAPVTLASLMCVALLQASLRLTCARMQQLITAYKSQISRHEAGAPLRHAWHEASVDMSLCARVNLVLPLPEAPPRRCTRPESFIILPYTLASSATEHESIARSA